MSEIKDYIAGPEFDELLQQVCLGVLDIVDSRINERLGMLKKRLSVVSAPADNTLSTSGMTWEVSGNVFRLWMLPHTCMGVVILIDCPSIIHLLLFTYLKFEKS